MIQEVAQNRSRAVLRSRNPSSMMLVQALRLHLGKVCETVLGVRPGGQTNERGDRLHTRQSGASFDIAGAGGRAGMSKIYPLP
jgi:hypothetical protein